MLTDATGDSSEGWTLTAGGGGGAPESKPKPKEALPVLEKEKRGEAKVGLLAVVFLAASVFFSIGTAGDLPRRSWGLRRAGGGQGFLTDGM